MAVSDWQTVANSLFGGSLGNLAAGAITGAGYYDQLQSLKNMGTTAQEGAEKLGQDLYSKSQFKPFTVTTGTGATAGWTPDGNMMTNLSGQEQGIQNQMLSGAQGLFGQALGSTAGREADVYERMRALQRPEEQMAQNALDEKLQAQGRLGIQTAQFGGTPEQLAQSRAVETAKNQASLGAMQQAQAEQMQQYNIGAGMLGGAYTPQQQLLSNLGAGTNLAQLAQGGQLSGVGYMGELGMSGLDAYLQSQLGAGNLAGQGLSALAGLFAPRQSTISKDGTTVSGDFDVFSALGNIAGDGWDWLTGNAGVANKYGTNPYSEQTQMLAEQEAGF